MSAITECDWQAQESLDDDEAKLNREKYPKPAQTHLLLTDSPPHVQVRTGRTSPVHELGWQSSERMQVLRIRFLLFLLQGGPKRPLAAPTPRCKKGAMRQLQSLSCFARAA